MSEQLFRQWCSVFRSCRCVPSVLLIDHPIVEIWQGDFAKNNISLSYLTLKGEREIYYFSDLLVFFCRQIGVDRIVKNPLP